MTILTREERLALRALYDFDKNDVLDVFLSKWQDAILKRPAVKDTQWDAIRTMLERDAQAVGIDELKTQFNEEISNMEIEKDGETVRGV